MKLSSVFPFINGDDGLEVTKKTLPLYKECAWDFEKDTLPTATYNEEGYVTNHIETKLYAKWIEN